MTKIYNENHSYQQIAALLQKHQSKKFLLVCGHSFDSSFLKPYMNQLDIPYIRFSDFTPNPTYESAVKGTLLFCAERCDFIVAIGGGSAIDLAKCIKVFHTMDSKQNFLKQPILSNQIPLLALPTTAGTGSESTRFAVIYRNQDKLSLSHECMMPTYVILEPSVLKTLPLHQKKSALLDALCQAIESMWSINSTEESKLLAQNAISMIMKYKDCYLSGSDTGNKKMLLAANLAGQAIDITQTTAAHAMSYKLTSLFGLSHGHAVALCLPKVWAYLLEHVTECSDERGADYLYHLLSMLSAIISSVKENNSIYEGLHVFESLMIDWDMLVSLHITEVQYSILTDSVNLERLKNTPVRLDKKAISKMYQSIFQST